MIEPRTIDELEEAIQRAEAAEAKVKELEIELNHIHAIEPMLEQENKLLREKLKGMKLAFDICTKREDKDGQDKERPD